MNRFWEAFKLWYYEPSLSKRVRQRSWELRLERRRLVKWQHDLNKNVLAYQEARIALGSTPAKVETCITALKNIEKRLDTLDDGYGALLGIDRSFTD